MAITNITEALDALQTLAEGLPAAVTVDDTLSVEGAAADAKAVGEALEVPVLDLVAMGMTELYGNSMQTFTLDAETEAAMLAAAANKMIRVKIRMIDADMIITPNIFSLGSEYALTAFLYDVINPETAAHILIMITLGGGQATILYDTVPSLNPLVEDISSHTNNTSNPHSVTAAQVGAAPAYSYGTDDLTAGTSALETGKLHFVYE